MTIALKRNLHGQTRSTPPTISLISQRFDVEWQINTGKQAVLLRVITLHFDSDQLGSFVRFRLLQISGGGPIHSFCTLGLPGYAPIISQSGHYLGLSMGSGFDSSLSNLLLPEN